MTGRRPAAGSRDRSSRRGRNRALLARQHLLERSRMRVDTLLEHLCGLQAQEPDSPYLALWSRLDGFALDDLTDRLLDRRVVRMTLMRGTIHLVTAADAGSLRGALQAMVERVHATNSWGKAVAGIPLADLVAAGADALTEPRTNAELADALASRWPERDPKALASAARFVVPTVQVPPRGTWRTGGTVRWVALDAWLRRPDRGAPVGVDELVRRYLGAFGPATPADAQVWSGLTRLREVFDRLRPELVVLQDDDGGELFDLPDASRPDEEVDAPVRFLPAFDNVLLSHADRTHVVPAAHRPRLAAMNGLPPATVLLDGFVGASWRFERSGPKRERSVALVVQPFGRLSRARRAAVEDEGSRLVAFAGADAAGIDVRIADPV